MLPLVILAAVLVPVGVGIWGIARAVSDAVDSTRSDVELTVTTGDNEILTDADGQPTEILALAQPSGGSDRVVTRATLDGDIAWQAPVVPDDVYSAQLRLAGDLVLASLSDQVVALDGRTGAERWRLTASDEVDPRCRDCFVVLGDVLVVLSRDAYVTAVGLDGTTLWTRRLDSPRATIRVVGDTLLVLDEPADGNTSPALVATDPATGEEGTRITPSCPDPAYPPEMEQFVDFDPGSLVLPVPGTDDVVLVFGFGPTCVQRWTVPTGEMRWSRASEVGAALHDPAVTSDGTDMVISDSSVLVHVGLSEGSVTSLPLPQDTSPTAVGVVTDGRFVTAVRSSRGTARLTLLALDLRGQETLWERALPRDVEAFDLSPARSSDVLFSDSARFLLTAGADGEITLVTLASPGQRLTVEGIDVATGEGRPLGRGTFAVRYPGSSSPSARIEAVTGGRVVFTTEGIPQVLDLATGRVIASWVDD